MRFHVNLADDPPTGLPVVSGTLKVTKTLTISTEGIADPDGLSKPQFAYGWHRVPADGPYETSDVNRIPFATSAKYRLAEADLGMRIRARVLVRDDDWNRVWLESDPFPCGGAMTTANNPATGEPKIYGIPALAPRASAYAVTDGIQDPDGLQNVTFRYHWFKVRNGVRSPLHDRPSGHLRELDFLMEESSQGAASPSATGCW